MSSIQSFLRGIWSPTMQCVFDHLCSVWWVITALIFNCFILLDSSFILMNWKWIIQFMKCILSSVACLIQWVPISFLWQKWWVYTLYSVSLYIVFTMPIVLLYYSWNSTPLSYYFHRVCIVFIHTFIHRTYYKTFRQQNIPAAKLKN